MGTGSRLAPLDEGPSWTDNLSVPTDAPSVGQGEPESAHREHRRRLGWAWVATGVALAIAALLGSRLVSSESRVRDGWKRFTGEGFEIHLPESYEGGNLDEVLETLRGMGAEGEEIADSFEAFPSMFAFGAYDLEAFPEEARGVSILRFPRFGQSAEDILDDVTAGVEETGLEVTERSTVHFSGDEAIRLIAEGRMGQLAGQPFSKNLVYYLLSGETMWTLTFASESAPDFNQHVPEFEESARSFAESLTGG